MIKGVKLVSIPVTNQDRALEFYTEKLGFKVATDQPFDDSQRWIELKIPGADTRVVLFTPETHKAWIGGFLNVTFHTSDLKKSYEAYRERGVQFEAAPTKEDWGSFAIFKDPDGNQFCLSQS